MALFLRTSSTMTCTPPRRWLLPAALARSSNRNFSCRPGTSACSLPWSGRCSLTLARRQVERQHDLGRLRAVGHFDVEHRFRLTHGQRLAGIVVACNVGGRLRDRDRPQARLPGDFQLQLERCAGRLAQIALRLHFQNLHAERPDVGGPAVTRAIVGVAEHDRQRIFAAVAVDAELRLIENLIDGRPERFVLQVRS